VTTPATPSANWIQIQYGLAVCSTTTGFKSSWRLIRKRRRLRGRTLGKNLQSRTASLVDRKIKLRFRQCPIKGIRSS
jgi:hypothetical protein